MKLQAIATTISLAAFITLVAPGANAGCGDLQQWRNQSAVNAAAFKMNRAAFVPASAGNFNGSSIVGMWNVTFTSLGNTTHNPPIPDGAPIDFGYAQWHSDGLELFNSGGRAPATQNFCMGIFRKIGFATYQLNHFAFGYDATTGVMNGIGNIRETVTLDQAGNTYSGTFTIDIYDPTSGSQLDHLAGTITGDRITVDTTP